MRKIDISTWERRDHFNFLRTFDMPHFNMCANVDVTALYPAMKGHDATFTIAMIYLIARTANDIPEFRHRMKADDVVEMDVIHPSCTILLDNNLFTFCNMEYDEDFTTFAPAAAERIAYVKEHPTLDNERPIEELVFMTAIPWVSFTSFRHPMHLSPVDSIPRFAWGKFFAEGDRLKMPLSVQGHHALLDGFHMGQFYAAIQDYLDQPDGFLG